VVERKTTNRDHIANVIRQIEGLLRRTSIDVNIKHFFYRKKLESNANSTSNKKKDCDSEMQIKVKFQPMVIHQR
jgi:hypothetical protein